MRVAFGNCVFDSETRELLRNGKPVHVSPKAFRLLELLVENRPRALSKEELYGKIWPNTFVSEANLATLASEVRRALGEKGRRSKFIRTVSGYGYAFSGEAIEERPAAGAGRAGRYFLVWEEREIPLVTGENLLGRDIKAQTRIEDSTVSRRHARVTIADSEARIEDLGSKNGTSVGGKRVGKKPTRLSDGDQIQLGSVFLTFCRVSPESSTQSIRSDRKTLKER